jgi:hypothetical protein
MGEPQTYTPTFWLQKDGTVRFTVSTEGIELQFDIDVECIDDVVFKLLQLKDQWEQGRP